MLCDVFCRFSLRPCDQIGAGFPTPKVVEQRKDSRYSNPDHHCSPWPSVLNPQSLVVLTYNDPQTANSLKGNFCKNDEIYLQRSSNYAWTGWPSYTKALQEYYPDCKINGGLPTCPEDKWPAAV